MTGTGERGAYTSARAKDTQPATTMMSMTMMTMLEGASPQASDSFLFIVPVGFEGFLHARSGVADKGREKEVRILYDCKHTLTILKFP